MMKGPLFQSSLILLRNLHAHRAAKVRCGGSGSGEDTYDFVLVPVRSLQSFLKQYPFMDRVLRWALRELQSRAEHFSARGQLRGNSRRPLNPKP